MVAKEIEPDEEDDYETDADQRRAKTSSPLDLDLSIEHDIEELGLSEMAMVKAFEVDDDDGEDGDKKPSASRATVTTIEDDEPPTEPIEGMTENDAICLLDDDEEEAVQETTESASATEAASDSAPSAAQKPEATESPNGTVAAEAASSSDSQPVVAEQPPPPQHWIDYPLQEPRYYKMIFTGTSYGITMLVLHGRIVVQNNPRGPTVKPSVGDVILTVNGSMLPPYQDLKLLSAEMKRLISLGPVELMFLESPTVPQMLKHHNERLQKAEEERAMLANAAPAPVTDNEAAPQQPVAYGSNGGATAASAVPQQENHTAAASGSQDEVIDLLDD
jgi:hypothetical protein